MNMKKLLCMLIIGCMLASTLAGAEGWLLTSSDTDKKLEAMIPVLDSLAIALKVTSDEVDDEDNPLQPAYNAADAKLVWTQLKTLAANWLANDPDHAEVDLSEGKVVVEGSTMDEIAAASFQGLQYAPLQPDDPADAEGMVYDQEDDVYTVPVGENQDHYMVIKRNARDGETMVVNCILYETETDRRLGAMTARMSEAVQTDPNAQAPMYPYVVVDAHAERADDFNGLWANECDIRYTPAVTAVTAEATTAAPKATATPKPTTRPSSSSSSSSSDSSSGSAYRRLARGSEGADVRTLQKRLNELGYDCGSADGIFGSGTERAVERFQEVIGVSQDGVASASLQKKLFSSSAPKYSEYEYDVLKRGASGSRVEKLQKRLRELGYTGHPVDGKYDSRIEDAVSLFQYTADLDVTGKADTETLEELYDSDAPDCTEFVNLEKGDSGRRVEEMQAQLIDLGYLREVSGKYDSKTVDAVADFKDDHGFSGNGKSISAYEISEMFRSTRPDPDEEEDVEPVPDEEEEDVDDDDDPGYEDTGDDDEDDPDDEDTGDDDDPEYEDSGDDDEEPEYEDTGDDDEEPESEDTGDDDSGYEEMEGNGFVEYED